MKIKSLEIKNSKVLKNISLDFCNENEIINTIVVAGSNGSGKTTLLECIYEGMKNLVDNQESQTNFTLKFEEDEEDKFQSISKIIYLPAEINFQKVKTESTNLEVEYRFLNTVNTNIIKNIPSYIASKIMYTANTEEDLTMKEVREKVTKEINEIFEILDIDIKLKGLSKDELSTPIFTNSSGDEFDINALSSGEKQLFLRALSVKMLEPKNSIILIDEPELSLHPKWQERILKVYERIGENNQLIVATHSPHILGSVPKENIIILGKNKDGKLIAQTGKKLNSSFGQPVNRILEDIMGMETTRNLETHMLLEEVRDMVRKDEYKNAEFQKKYKNLKTILGMVDSDLLLIDMEIRRKESGIVCDKS